MTLGGGGDLCADGLGYLGRSGGTAKIARMQGRIRRDVFDGLHHPRGCFVSPRCSSNMTTDQNVPTGFAQPLPMMSKAEPWIGSNIDG